jgi:hypothetical protein
MGRAAGKNQLRMRITYVALFILFSCNKKKDIIVEEVKDLHYPSASAVTFYDNKIYLIGDDAPFMVVLDKQLTPVDSIPLFTSNEARIPKNIKPDLESVTLVTYQRHPMLLAMSSGSLAPYRNICLLIDPGTRKADSTRLDAFFRRINEAGIKDLNVEGLAAIPGGILMAARGNKSYPKNHLIYTISDFWKYQDTADFRLIKTGVNNDTAVFNGISGLEYSPRTDKLLLTVSTEDTYSSHGDGAIGKSYLWIINDISTKKRYSAINPNRVIDLPAADDRFKGQKIESVCILSETRKQMMLLLVADNDRGGSSLFRILLNK